MSPPSERHTLDPRLSKGVNLSGSHETPGEHNYGDLKSDIVDIDVVVKYLKSKYGYLVTMMVSHSRASMSTMLYLCTHEEAATSVECFVNVSGRYRVRKSIILEFPADEATHFLPLGSRP